MLNLSRARLVKIRWAIAWNESTAYPRLLEELRREASACFEVSLTNSFLFTGPLQAQLLLGQKAVGRFV